MSYPNNSVEEELRIWFQNLVSNKINSSVLFVKTQEEDGYSIETLFKQEHVHVTLIRHSNLILQMNNSILQDKNNIIIYPTIHNSNSNSYEQKYYKLLTKLAHFNVLFLEVSHQHIASLFESNFENFQQQLIKCAYFQKVDFYKLIKNKNPDELYKYFDNIQRVGSIISIVQTMAIDDFFMTIKSSLSWIKSDIVTLANTNVLTSRLAILLYRSVCLDFSSSVTHIGRYIHKVFGVKSKTINSRYPALQGYTLNVDLFKKNFRAYDLSIDESEVAIRREIAKNLLKLAIKPLDNKKIAKATGLSENEIMKISKKI